MLAFVRILLPALLGSALLVGCAHRPAPTPRTVLFDEGHGQRFFATQAGELDLSGLAAAFTDEGFRVTTSKLELTDDLLSQVDALVVSGPFAPFSEAEIASTQRFLDRGGRAAFMLHIGQPLVSPLERLGVLISTGVIHERENIIDGDPLNFRVGQLAPDDLTRDVTEFRAYGAWALNNAGPSTRVIVTTSPSAWIDLNQNREFDARDAVQAFGLVVVGEHGRGRFAVFGDDAIFQNRFLTDGNLRLGRNLARWCAAP